MNRSAIWREAWLDLRSGTTRAGVLTCAFALVVFLLSFQDSQTVIQLLRSAQEYQRAGASVHLVAAPGRVDGAACERLNEYPGVHAAAFRMESRHLQIATASSVPLPVVTATASAPDVLRVQPLSDRAIGGFLGPEAADLLPRGAHSLVTQLGAVPIGGTYAYPNDGRRGGLAYAIVTPTLDYEQPFDECWLSSWPEVSQPNSLLATTISDPATGVPQEDSESATEYTQLNSTLGREFNGDLQFSSRASALNHVFGAAIGILFGLLAYWPRRLSIASALHLGASKTDLLRIHLIQHVAWILTGTFMAIALAMLCAAGSGVLGDVLSTILLPPCFAALGSVTTICIALATLRPNRLLRMIQMRQ